MLGAAALPWLLLWCVPALLGRPGLGRSALALSVGAPLTAGHPLPVNGAVRLLAPDAVPAALTGHVVLPPTLLIAVPLLATWLAMRFARGPAGAAAVAGALVLALAAAQVDLAQAIPRALVLVACAALLVRSARVPRVVAACAGVLLLLPAALALCAAHGLAYHWDARYDAGLLTRWHRFGSAGPFSDARVAIVAIVALVVVAVALVAAGQLMAWRAGEASLPRAAGLGALLALPWATVVGIAAVVVRIDVGGRFSDVHARVAGHVPVGTACLRAALLAALLGAAGAVMAGRARRNASAPPLPLRRLIRA